MNQLLYIELKRHYKSILKKYICDKIINSRFDVNKIYTEEEIANDEILSTIKLNDKDIPFSVTYQIQPAEGIDTNSLTIPDGEYDQNLGWVKNINRVGILKYDSNNYSITNFGTGW